MGTVPGKEEQGQLNRARYLLELADAVLILSTQLGTAREERDHVRERELWQQLREVDGEVREYVLKLRRCA